MNLLQRLASNGVDPRKCFLPSTESKPAFELALSVLRSRVSSREALFNFAAGLTKGLWEDGDGQFQWQEFTSMEERNSENHKEFVNGIVTKLWYNDSIGRSLRIAIGKHKGIDADTRKMNNEYDDYIDVDMQSIRKLGDKSGKDVLTLMFYHLLGYNKYGSELLPIIFKEEEEWRKLNTVPTVLQDLTPRRALSDSKPSISIKPSETPPTMRPDVEM